MIKSILNYILLGVVFFVFGISMVSAEAGGSNASRGYSESSDGKENFVIIPNSETDITQDVKYIGTRGGEKNDQGNEKTVWDKYNEKADEMETGEQLASGVMNWDTILNYIKYLGQFLKQIGLVIVALMVIYSGYRYAMNVFTGSGASEGKKALTNAIIGLLIVIFAYFIVAFLINMFWH